MGNSTEKLNLGTNASAPPPPYTGGPETIA